MAKSGTLTPQQQKFVQRYLVHFNATKAAKEAGYSEKTARSQGQRLLTNVDIEYALNLAMQETKKRNNVDEDWVVQRLMRIADSSMSKVCEVRRGRLTLREDLTPEEIDCLASYSESDNQYGGSVTWKVKDQVKALELLGKHIGMWGDKGNDSEHERINKSVGNRVFELLKGAG